MQCFAYGVFFVISTLISATSANESKINFNLPCGLSPECIKTTIQSAIPAFVEGNPAYGADSLDPFILDKLELLLPGGLKVEFINGVSKGLKRCTVDSARFADDVLQIQFHCSLTIKGKYKSSGRLIMFAIDGDGDSMIKCKNIKIQFIAKLATTTGQDGQEYLKISNYKVDHSFDGQVVYRMTNLIRGSPQLSNVILQFMNRNWRMVAEEFGKPIVDFGVATVLNNVKKLIQNVPLNRLSGTDA